MTDIEKVVQSLKDSLKNLHCGFVEGVGNVYAVSEETINHILELLKEQEAKPPIHVHEEYPEHDWETDKNGKIDEWAMSYGYHNGPACKRCYYSFCIHCKPNGFNDQPCVIDEYKCPKCGCILPKGVKFCSECGQELKWE